MAGEGDAERLVVLLEARVKDFEKNMQKASGTADRTYGNMRRSSQTATRNMERDMVRSTGRINRAVASSSGKIGAFAKGGLGLLAAAAAASIGSIVSVAAALHGAKDAMEDLDKIGKSAKAGGLDPETWQELAYAAELGGVETSTFAKSMEIFSKNTGLAASGQGRLITQLKALNPQLLENLQNATTQAERVRIVADALDKESDASKKAAIASALFGEAGVKMVEVLKGGASALQDTANKAHDLGIIIDSELISRAETMNDEFTTATRVMDAQFKQALIDLAPILIGSAKLAGGLANSIALVVDQMRAVDDRIFLRPLQNEMAAVVNERLKLADGIAQMESKLSGVDRTNPAVSAMVSQLRTAKDEFDALTDRALTLQDRMKEIQSREATKLTLPDLPDLPDDRTNNRNDAAKKALQQSDAVKELIASLEFEKSLIGLSAVEQAKLNTLRQAGAAATDEQRLRISELVEQTYAEHQQVEDLSELYDMLGKAGTTAVMDIIDAMKDGKIEASELGDILSNILSMAGNYFLNVGLKSLGGALGFPGFADGTANTGGARGQVRGVVHGQEAVIPLPNGGRVPVQMINGSNPASAAATQKIMIRLEPGLIAEILNATKSQTVELIQPLGSAVIVTQRSLMNLQSRANSARY